MSLDLLQWKVLSDSDSNSEFNSEADSELNEVNNDSNHDPLLELYSELSDSCYSVVSIPYSDEQWGVKLLV